MDSRGGQANEAGSSYRAGVATLIAVLGLVGRPILALEYTSNQSPNLIEFETTDPLDDIAMTNTDGSRAFFQCKRTCGRDAALRSALHQIITHTQTVGFDDRLIIASADFIGAIRELPTALRKRRNGGVLTSRERNAITAIREELSQQDCQETERVLDTLYAWRVDAADTVSPEYEPAAAWMSTILASNVQADSALAVIKTLVHRLAASAGTCTVIESWEALLAGGITLKPDLAGAPAQQLEAHKRRIEEYRKLLAANQGIVRTPIKCSVPELNVTGLINTIQALVDDEDAKSRSTGTLLNITRRLRRFILHAGPGAGKTTTIEQLAAHYAATPDTPVPIIVRLRKLARQAEFPTDISMRVLLSCADHAEAEQVYDSIRALGDLGNVIFILDGLDECRTSVHDVLSGLSRLTTGPMREAGVIVTTRPSVLDQARQLDLPTVSLSEPKSPRSIPLQLIGKMAQDRPSDGRAEWVRHKTISFDRVLERSRDISGVPLLSMIVAILVAGSDNSEATSSAADVLERAVRTGVDEHERRRTNGELIPYDNGLLTAPRLFDAYVSIGRALAISQPLSLADSKRSVAETFMQAWRIPPRDAEELASASVVFWDETMSIFVANSSGIVEARSQQFVELADALWVASASSDDRDAWITNALRDASMIDTVLLAFSKSTELADAALTAENYCERAVLWVARYGSENSLPATTLERCLSLLHLNAEEKHRTQRYEEVDWDSLDRDASVALRDGPQWQFVLAAARLRCPAKLRALRNSILSLAEYPDEKIIADAFARVTDASVDNRSMTEEDLDAFVSALSLPLPQHGEPFTEETRRGSIFHLVSGEPLLTGRVELVGSALSFISNFTSEIAQLMEPYASFASFSSGLEIRILSTLRAAGYPVQQNHTIPPLHRKLVEAPDGRRWGVHEIEAIGRVTDKSVNLRPSELWWATEIFDLIDAMDLGKASYQEMTRELWTAEISDDLTRLTRLYCVALDADPARVRAIVEKAKAGGDDELQELISIGYISMPPPYQRSAILAPDSADQLQDEILYLMSSPSNFIARATCRIIWNIKSQVLSEKLLSMMKSDEAPHRYLTSIIAFQTSITPDRMLRQISEMKDPEFIHHAARISSTVDTEGHMSTTRYLWASDDLTIRILSGAPESEDHTAIYWSCDRCWNQNKIPEEDCQHCPKGFLPDRTSRSKTHNRV